MTEDIRQILKTASKAGVRKPTASVSIIWGGKGVDTAEVTVAPQPNRASIAQQVATSIGQQKKWMFCATGSDTSVALLDGTCHLMPTTNDDESYTGEYLVGWWGDGTNMSNGNSEFTHNPTLTLVFSSQSIQRFRLCGYLSGDDAEYPVDFIVSARDDSGIKKYSDIVGDAVVKVTGNNVVDFRGEFEEPLHGTTMLTFEILKWSHRNACVKITSAFDEFSGIYDSGDIMALSILEEAEGSVGTLPVGNISCNEISLTLQNLDDDYFIGNPNSRVAGMTRSNRRVEPSIGFVTLDENGNKGEEILVPKGVYWTGDWNVSDSDAGASTTAVDRLGLLQNIEYDGIEDTSYADNHGDTAEQTYWEGKTLYEIATCLLTDLRNRYMNDLTFYIDKSLDSDDLKIPFAFFKNQSYFDVIRTIAQAGFAYAYMDVPEQVEIEEAAGLGFRCADVLRIKRIDNFLATNEDIDLEAEAEFITQDDIITKTLNSRRGDTANIIHVPWQEYTLSQTTGELQSGDVQYVTVEDDKSILEYGRIEYEFPENPLIQSEAYAETIANQILQMSCIAPRRAEVDTFGDVTRGIGDIWDMPEYQKRGVESRGYYAVTRIQTEYDGSLRQTVTCRRITDKLPPVSWDIIDETGYAEDVVDESSVNPNQINEGGTV